MRIIKLFHAVAFLSAVVPTVLLPVGHAETTVITTEASYIMGDGESPSFVEAQVLQKAKQAALEQAGTYVEAYTKTQNYDLTTDEIQTLAGGVLKVEVLEKSRTLVGEGLRFYTKIKATVTTDKMEELAQRIRGKNVAEEYKKFQTEYARISRELETWKQMAAGTATGAERQTALDRIKESEQAFAQVQENEATLFRRLLSGQTLIAQAQDAKAAIGRIIDDIIAVGHEIVIGEASVNLPTSESDKVTVSIPITVKASPSLTRILTDSVRSFGGTGTMSVRSEIIPASYDVTNTVGNRRFPKAQAEQTFHFVNSYDYDLKTDLTHKTYYKYQTSVKGAKFLLSENRHINKYFHQQLLDLMLVVRLSSEDGKEFRCATSSIVNRLFVALVWEGERGKGDAHSYDLAITDYDNWFRSTQTVDAVILADNAISFEVEFTLPQEVVTRLKVAEATYGKSKQAPEERCRIILPRG